MSASTVRTSIISELVEFNYTSFPQGKCAVPAHLHHFYQLDVVLSGRVTLKLENTRPFIGRAGDGWLIPPLVRHGFEIREPFTQASFKFHLSPHCWELFGDQFLRRRIPRELMSVARAVGVRYRDSSCLVIPEAVAAATLCLVKFLGQNKPATTHMETLDPFRCTLWPLLEQIANAPHTGWTVGRMANACHLSDDYFSRCFHKVMGQTPQRYVVESRMRAAAAALLAESSRPIKDIAEEANYATIHAFSRAFRQVMGIAPAAYRRASHTL